MFYDLITGYGISIAVVTGIFSVAWVVALWFLASYIVPKKSEKV